MTAGAAFAATPPTRVAIEHPERFAFATPGPGVEVVTAPRETLALDYGVDGTALLLDRITCDGPRFSVDGRYDDDVFAAPVPAASG